mmetsp:Transcript_44721/g.108447  ORF Transcript_44721/g.108447 Transcript_44721/m.108447 type:complete len:1316 (-) Transcript_44721:94-4041(-)
MPFPAAAAGSSSSPMTGGGGGGGGGPQATTPTSSFHHGSIMSGGDGAPPTASTTSSAVLETTSAASFQTLSPISTLQEQYEGPLGQRLVLGIQANAAACCLEGGLVGILKLQQQAVAAGATSSSSINSSFSSTGNVDPSSTELESSLASSATAGAGAGAGAVGNGLTSVSLDGNDSTAPSAVGGEGGDDFDAFAFLQEDDGNGGTNGPTPGGGDPSVLDGSNKKNKGGAKAKFGQVFGSLKKVAKSTTAQLERSMQGLAVRMDQGRNPDLLRVALYDASTSELLDVTESVPVPTERSDVRFEVPLVVAGSRRQQPVVVKLWIQSGAALLQSTKIAAKHYLLGSAVVDCMKLVPGAVSTLTLGSQLVVGGQIQLCVLPDPKFAPLLQRGWSLTDPDMSGYTSELSHLPLDQTYILEGKQPQHWLVAQERAVESSVVLPVATAVMELTSKSCDVSLNHAQSVANLLRDHRHDYKDPGGQKATCQLGIVGVLPKTSSAGGTAAAAGGGGTPTYASANVSLSWRRPDSIFELELSANETLPVLQPNVAAGFGTVKHTFHPKLCFEPSDVLPGILQAYGGKLPPSGYLLGGLYIGVTISTAAATGGGKSSDPGQIEVWQTVIGLESFINTGTSANQTIQVPLYKNKDEVGHVLVQIQVSVPETAMPDKLRQSNYHKTLPATDGLVSLMGLENLADGVKPYLDAMAPDASIGGPSLRHQQLNTMGFFFTTQYMEQHLALRSSALDAFSERTRSYKQALVQPEKNVESYTLKTPKNFRPSSSRTQALLSGIPFNAHIASLNVNVMDATHPKTSTTAEYPGASFHNVTCGAPSDHARGFGNILANVSNLNVSGGLRRLEAQRLACAQQLIQAQSMLIAGVGNYLGAARQTGGANINHIPARHAEIQQLRWKVFECVHNLHHVTWMCSVRRANVFSQSLGLAVSSYLASVSDRNKCAAGWPDLWRRHGFLVCFEGLLSAAGKELGMIEDASVAIDMLRMVRIVLMPDQGIPSKAVYIPSSPYLKWVNLFSSGEGSSRRFMLQIGIDPQYYAERIPVPLQNNAAVQLYPLLYQVGVDIRQFGAHTAANLMKNGQKQAASPSSQQQSQPQVTGGLVDGEDDDVGVVDEDVLVALNYEALRKMNCYAHAISPQEVTLDKVQAAMAQVFAPPSSGPDSTAAGEANKDPLPVHPSLSSLHSHILSSAGKMNHNILDEAATIAQQLGGGGIVFCKSGKDRTAMHVTYKQSQFAARYRGNHNNQEAILRDATLIRLYGTRLPICEKNVGQAKYAFNSLQVKFMPDELKPPMNTLAGFLKGGEIFKGGGIES